MEDSKRKPVSDIVITVCFDGVEESRNLIEDLTVDNSKHINEYLEQASGIVAWWNHKLQQAKDQIRKQKYRIEIIEAELDKDIRERLETEIEAGRRGKYSEAEVKNQIVLDGDLQGEKEKLLDMEETEGYLKAAVEALREKRSALIGLGANKRTEYSGNKIGNTQDTNRNESLSDRFRRTVKNKDEDED